MTNPVSDALTTTLRRRIDRHGLVVWLDVNAHFTGYIDRLITGDDLGADVVAFRGSYLKVMDALDAHPPPQQRTGDLHPAGGHMIHPLRKQHRAGPVEGPAARRQRSAGGA